MFTSNQQYPMSNQNDSSLYAETLITLDKAAEDFGGVPIPYNTLKKYVYRGVNGLKLETVFLNKRFTSKEAIRRFLDRRQNLGSRQEKPQIPRMSQEEVDAGLRRHGIVE